MRLLLDTHILIWLVDGAPALRPETRTTIEQAARANGILIPAIAFWEVAQLAQRRRIALTMPMGEWRARVLALPGVAEAPLSSEIAVEAVHLPGTLHGEPADRFIVATARVAGARLASYDERIFAYGAEGHVDVLPRPASD